MLDVRTMKDGLGPQHTLSDDERTMITEHADESPGMSGCYVAPKLDNKREMVYTALRKAGQFPYQISMLHELKPEDYTRVVR